MKMSLQLKTGQRQRLAMTPQLQQAIRMLQLPGFELRREIQQALESNPMLEAVEYEADCEVGHEVGHEKHGEYGIDSDFSGGGYAHEREVAAGQTLQEHLLWQLNLSSMSEREQAIGVAVIDGIDENGMLTMDLESVRDAFRPGTTMEMDEPVTTEEIEAVLYRVQRFDPVGVGYRSLAECLLIQLGQMKEEGQGPPTGATSGCALVLPTALSEQKDPQGGSDCTVIVDAEVIVGEHLQLLGRRDYARLRRRTGFDETRLQQAVELIESLDPRPGARISPAPAAYIVPDLVANPNADGGWRVELNPHAAPRLRISPGYAALINTRSTTKDSTRDTARDTAKDQDALDTLRERLQSARWFISGLKSRNETLVKVASRILERQHDFLESGEEAMKPLVLQDIAEAVGVHESTVSRATAGKYMHTPRGLYELKYFFSSHLSGDRGEEHSSTAVRAIVKRLIAAENTRRPLSDSKITELLGQRGIWVARRTIAKYRGALAIPPSNERKRLL